MVGADTAALGTVVAFSPTKEGGEVAGAKVGKSVSFCPKAGTAGNAVNRTIIQQNCAANLMQFKGACLLVAMPKPENGGVRHHASVVA